MIIIERIVASKLVFYGFWILAVYELQDHFLKSSFLFRIYALLHIFDFYHRIIHFGLIYMKRLLCAYNYDKLDR